MKKKLFKMNKLVKFRKKTLINQQKNLVSTKKKPPEKHYVCLSVCLTIM